MNQSPAAQKPNVVSPESLLEKAFENPDFSGPGVVEEIDIVTHTEDDKNSIKNSWAEFYALRTENTEAAVSKVELSQMTVESQFSQPLKVFETEESNTDNKPVAFIEDQKGSGSAWAESGLKILPDFKDLGKSLFGALNIFKELFMDTAKVFKTALNVEKAVDPEKAKAEAEKKAEKQRKKANINTFIQAMQSQISALANPEATRMETQEKENINKTVKLNVSYKGIKDFFGRLTIYAASMFEREQLDEEKKMKKVEKEQKMASVSKGPDLNMDKVAEGGFLSSTGGQGAG